MTTETTAPTLPAWIIQAHQETLEATRTSEQGQEAARPERSRQARADLLAMLDACFPGWQEHLRVEFNPDGSSLCWDDYPAMLTDVRLREPITGLSCDLGYGRDEAMLHLVWPGSGAREVVMTERRVSTRGGTEWVADGDASDRLRRLGEGFWQAWEVS